MRDTRRIAPHASRIAHPTQTQTQTPRQAPLCSTTPDPPLCLFRSAISAFCLSFARFFSSLSASFLSFLISLFFRPLYGFAPTAAGMAEAWALAWAWAWAFSPSGMGARGSLARFLVGDGFSMDTVGGTRGQRVYPGIQIPLDVRDLINQLERGLDGVTPRWKWRDHGGWEREGSGRD